MRQILVFVIAFVLGIITTITYQAAADKKPDPCLDKTVSESVKERLK